MPEDSSPDTPENSIELVRIVITQSITENDSLMGVVVEGGPPLYVQLGLIELAKDTLIQRAAEMADEEEEEDDG